MYECYDKHCEFFVCITPGYTFVMTHNSMIYSFEDEDDEWICEELEGIWFDDIDCWVD